MSYLFYDMYWDEINEQDWPNVYDSVWIMKIRSKTTNGKQWGVFQWEDNPHENVLSLGEFWTLKNAKIFANAKIDDLFKESKAIMTTNLKPFLEQFWITHPSTEKSEFYTFKPDWIATDKYLSFDEHNYLLLLAKAEAFQEAALMLNTCPFETRSAARRVMLEKASVLYAKAEEMKK